MRYLVSAAAHGSIGTSPGFKSAARFCKYFGPGTIHIPERSALPSALRGVGAVRSALPSFVLGIPLSGSFSHCADSGTATSRNRRLLLGVIARLYTFTQVVA